MNTEDTKPGATRVGTIELGLELKDMSAVLAGLEQIKVAALEAAAAVASIRSASSSPATAPTKSDAAMAAAFADQWVKEVRCGCDLYGMPPRTVAEFISALAKLGVVR